MPLELDRAQLPIMIGTLLSIIPGNGNSVPCHRYFADFRSLALSSQLPAFIMSRPTVPCGLSNDLLLGSWPQNRRPIILQTVGLS